MSTKKYKLSNGVLIEMTQTEIDEQTKSSTEIFNQAMEDLRRKRNALLAETDWTVLTDVPLEPAEKSKMMQYRSTLRNITNGLKTVEDVNAVKLPGIPVL